MTASIRTSDIARRAGGLVLAVLTVLPAPASAWWARNRHEVFPVGDGVFEVVAEPGSGAQDFWCAAGDYASVALGVKAGQRIYTWRGIGPSATRPGRKAMQFAFRAPDGADTSPSLTLSMTRVGDNLMAAAAQQYCYGGRFTDPWDRWFQG